MSSTLQPKIMTADAFLALPESPTRMELIAGELVVPPSPEYVHQSAQREIIRILLGVDHGEVLSSPMDVRLDDQNVLEPDVLWLADDTTCVVDRIIYGAPDLVVEILSPSTAKRDWQDKFRLYEQHGTREYWIVDPVGQTVERFVRQDDHLTHRGTYTDESTFHSELLKADISLSRLFSRKR